MFERSNAALRQIARTEHIPNSSSPTGQRSPAIEHDWFSDDGIHLRTAGAYAAGDYISRKMAFLDAQPCPVPSYAGVEPIDPCPDPDEHGPVIDLASLYPLTQRGPDANFQLSWEGSGSWPAAPWWER